MRTLGYVGFFLLLGSCAGPAPTPPEASARVEELLMQMIDRGMNRLGQPGGFWSDPAVRIGLPDDLARAEKNLRRFGMERPLEEFHAGLNHAAEAAMPAAKTLLRESTPACLGAEPATLLVAGSDAVTRRMQERCDALLLERLRPLVAEAMTRQQLLAAYRKLMKRLSTLERSPDAVRPDLETWLTRATLNGMYSALADEERRLRRKAPGAAPK